jgi:hypothetical protein
MNNFRLSNKKIHNDSRSSIENLHNEKMDNIFKKYNSINKKKEKLNFLNDKLKILNKEKYNDNINIINELEKDIISLKKEIYEIENNFELIDYMDKAWTFIENFKDNDYNNVNNNDNNNDNNIDNDNLNNNNINNNNQNNNNNNNNDSNIIINNELDKNTNILKFINKTGKTNKGEEYNRYYNKCFLNINSINSSNNSNSNCKNCSQNDFEIDFKNALIICTNCGSCDQYYDYSVNGINYSDSVHIETVSQPFSYQRKNHFREWLNQLQGKEVTVIPDTVINLIFLEIKKERITNLEDITSERIKKYLKKLKLNKYYEHIPNLISKITNKPPLTITKDFEEILLEHFDKIQEPFQKHCPKDRKNFLSYSYTLHKFCQLLGKNEYLIYFPLLKSREKLFEQEKIWKGICNDLKWQFISSV